MYSVSMNIHVQAFIWTYAYILISLECTCRDAIAELHCNSVLEVWGTVGLFPKAVAPFYILSATSERPFLYILPNSYHLPLAFGLLYPLSFVYSLPFMILPFSEN